MNATFTGCPNAKRSTTNVCNLCRTRAILISNQNKTFEIVGIISNQFYEGLNTKHIFEIEVR